MSADTEGAASITIVERVDQYVIDAGIVIRLDEMRIGRLTPYVAGGAGYLRQLHEGLTAIEQGHVYHLGGGLTRDVVTRNRGVIRAAGLRVDARVYFLSGGISLGNGVVTQGTMTGGLFFRFLIGSFDSFGPFGSFAVRPTERSEREFRSIRASDCDSPRSGTCSCSLRSRSSGRLLIPPLLPGRDGPLSVRFVHLPRRAGSLFRASLRRAPCSTDACRS